MGHHILKKGERHQSGTWLHDVILGGQDGLVNVLGIVLGVTAAGGETNILIAASLAAAFSEAISMGAVAYTSTLAERDHYRKEQEREESEVENVPERETAEVRQIYAAKGFKGELLDRIVSHITSNKTTWINIMMKEELGLQEVNTRDVIRSSIIVTIAAVLGSLIPLWPFFLFSRGTAEMWATVSSALILFIVGVYEAKTYVGSWWKQGIQMVLIGLGAAAAGFFIGRIFHI